MYNPYRRQSPRYRNPGREYYDDYYGGRPNQYDLYYYQRQGSSIGPSRHTTRYYNKDYNQDPKKPRQYRGPKQYRSPPPKDDFDEYDLDSRTDKTPFKSYVKSDDAFSTPLPISPLIMDKNEKIRKYSPRTPVGVTGPSRNAFSPGASDDIFSPDNNRRSQRRYNPY